MAALSWAASLSLPLGVRRLHELLAIGKVEVQCRTAHGAHPTRRPRTLDVNRDGLLAVSRLDDVVDERCPEERPDAEKYASSDLLLVLLFGRAWPWRGIRIGLRRIRSGGARRCKCVRPEAAEQSGPAPVHPLLRHVRGSLGLHIPNQGRLITALDGLRYRHVERVCRKSRLDLGRAHVPMLLLGLGARCSIGLALHDLRFRLKDAAGEDRADHDAGGDSS